MLPLHRYSFSIESCYGAKAGWRASIGRSANASLSAPVFETNGGGLAFLAKFDAPALFEAG
jgi:hypothetical protein